MKTCNNCRQRENCKELCISMHKVLQNSIKKNGLYSNTTQTVKNTNLNENEIDSMVFTHGLSDIEKRDTKRILIAVLKPDEAKILKMISSGMEQKEIGDILGLTQPAISIRLKNIQKKLKDSIVLVLPYIS